MEDKRNSNKRQVLSQNRLVEALLPPRQRPRKTQQKYKRKKNLFASRKRQLHIANLIPIWGSSDREEGVSPPHPPTLKDTLKEKPPRRSLGTSPPTSGKQTSMAAEV
ncbi:hypothetical protein AVEN_165797-1 [Araneus ventricosus]|uniref:Uncharacterized protein n=1 Tax=Araneus ventricosus TaxID=182803 RepID=A0A4Y2WQJ2_ARAVE|nr:hypothetical protein AVEN_165797-1 [Araneus ventricosus]